MSRRRDKKDVRAGQSYTRAQLDTLKLETLKEIHAKLVSLNKKIPPKSPADYKQGGKITNESWRMAILETQKAWSEAKEKAAGIQLSLFDILPTNPGLEEKSSGKAGRYSRATATEDEGDLSVSGGDVPAPLSETEAGNQSEESPLPHTPTTTVTTGDMPAAVRVAGDQSVEEGAAAFVGEPTAAVPAAAPAPEAPAAPQQAPAAPQEDISTCPPPSLCPSAPVGENSLVEVEGGALDAATESETPSMPAGEDSLAEVGLASGMSATQLVAHQEKWMHSLQLADSRETIQSVAAHYRLIYGPDYEMRKQDVWGMLSDQTKARIRQLMSAGDAAIRTAPPSGRVLGEEDSLAEAEGAYSPPPATSSIDAESNLSIDGEVDSDTDAQECLGGSATGGAGAEEALLDLVANTVGSGAAGEEAIESAPPCESAPNGEDSAAEVKGGAGAGATESTRSPHPAEDGNQLIADQAAGITWQPDRLSREERQQAVALQQIGFDYLGLAEKFSSWWQELKVWGSWKFLVVEEEVALDAVCRGELFSKNLDSEPDFGLEDFLKRQLAAALQAVSGAGDSEDNADSPEGNANSPEDSGEPLPVESVGEKVPVESVGEPLPVESVGEKVPVESVGEKVPVESVGERFSSEDLRGSGAGENENLQPGDRVVIRGGDKDWIGYMGTLVEKCYHELTNEEIFLSKHPSAYIEWRPKDKKRYRSKRYASSTPYPHIVSWWVKVDYIVAKYPHVKNLFFAHYLQPISQSSEETSFSGKADEPLSVESVGEQLPVESAGTPPPVKEASEPLPAGGAAGGEALLDAQGDVEPQMGATLQTVSGAGRCEHSADSQVESAGSAIDSVGSPVGRVGDSERHPGKLLAPQEPLQVGQRVRLTHPNRSGVIAEVFRVDSGCRYTVALPDGTLTAVDRDWMELQYPAQETAPTPLPAPQLDAPITGKGVPGGADSSENLEKCYAKTEKSLQSARLKKLEKQAAKFALLAKIAGKLGCRRSAIKWTMKGLAVEALLERERLVEGMVVSV
jgi:hypothetical protein